jgi:hypothetical protein
VPPNAGGRLSSAARVLIKEAAADIEILVVAGWKGRAFVFGKPLEVSRRNGWVLAQSVHARRLVARAACNSF